jgi:hypothetical protein
MTRRPGLVALSVLLPLMGALLALQAAFDNLILWGLFVLTALAIFVIGVASAAATARRSATPGPAATSPGTADATTAADTADAAARRSADAARLDELEPLHADDESTR